MKGLLIAGAGGHGKVVADAANAMKCWDMISFLDDHVGAEKVLDFPVLGGFNDAASLLADFPDIVVAVGDNVKRVTLINKFSQLGFNLPAVIHPSAVISPFSTIGLGTVIFAQTAVNPGASLGKGCIINTGATVDHDCAVDEGVHLSPGVHLAGEVKIGKNTWVGTGSSIIQQVSVGENVIIGAGSVIIKPVENNVTVAGVPGKVIKRNDK